MCLRLHAVQKYHKVNDKITIPRRGYLPEHVPIQKLDIKGPQTSSNHPKAHQFRIQQVKNNILGICAGLHKHHQYHKEENGRSDCTAPIKRTGQTLFHVSIHWEISPHIHVDRATN